MALEPEIRCLSSWRPQAAEKESANRLNKWSLVTFAKDGSNKINGEGGDSHISNNSTFLLSSLARCR